MILTKSFLADKAKDLGITETNYRTELNESIYEFSSAKQYDLFLSHSYLDKKSVSALAKLFDECGYSVYIDWLEDTELDRDNVTPATARKLKKRMNNSKGLAYLATRSITKSTWCPWELGYFDGRKNERCCILPVLEYRASEFNGQEYLGLYPYLIYQQSKAGNYNFWVQDNVDRDSYVVLFEWLNGKEPYKHSEE